MDMPNRIDMYDVAGRPLIDGDGHRLTLEEFMVAQGESFVLPRRHASDLLPLMHVLDNLIFQEKALQEGAENIDNERFYGQWALLSADRLQTILGRKWQSRFHYRDWTDALEMTLMERGCPKQRIEFGKNYRVNFNYDGEGGVLIIINESLLDRCVAFRSHSTPLGQLLRASAA